MRELTLDEFALVAGAGDGCSGGGESTSGNEVAGVSNFEKIGDDLIAFYEGLVQATSHIIERVAEAF